MAKHKPHHTLADYVAIAISPALIMALVCSLIFFLLAVMYDGDFVGRLRWVLFWYIFGTVLVARISMETGISERAPLYGLVLAGLVWVSLLLYIDYPAGTWALGAVINLGLIGLIWWSTYRLTWDCTYIDDKVEQSGEGLLQATGLENASPANEPQDGADSNGLGWLERYKRYRAARNKKHSPGTWVIYFSLAALPIFGLGQSLIPVEDEERRRNAFWLMGIYAGSGLGLLLTTSFLGLRRYLRQRDLQMPGKMTSVWLGVGTAMVLALIVVCALLPRPDSETSLFSLAKLGAERNASKYNFLDEKPGKGEGSPSSEQPKEKQQANPGSKGEKDPKGGDPAKGNSGQGGSGEKDNSDSRDKQNSSSSADKQNSAPPGDKSNDPSKGQKAEAGDRKGDPNKNPKGDKAKQRDQAQSSSGGSSSDKSESQQSKKSPSSPSRQAWAKSLSIPPAVGSVLKWIVFGVLAIVVVIVLLRQGLGFLANFTDWARNVLDALRAFWARLFGGPKADTGEEVIAKDTPGMRPRPFSELRNPFLDGRADRLSPQDLVRYSFTALQAWACERDLGRAADETPLEFADRLGHELPALEAEARMLSLLYARVAYARGSLPPGSAAAVEQFWNRLGAMAEQPMSA